MLLTLPGHSAVSSGITVFKAGQGRHCHHKMAISFPSLTPRPDEVDSGTKLKDVRIFSRNPHPTQPHDCQVRL